MASKETDHSRSAAASDSSACLRSVMSRTAQIMLVGFRCGISQQGDVDFGRPPAAVRANNGVLGVPYKIGLDELADVAGGAIDIFRRQEIEAVGAVGKQIVDTLETAQQSRLLVGYQYAAIKTGEDNRVGRRLDDAAEPLFALPQCLLRPLAVGNVLARAQRADALAGRVPQQGVVPGDDSLASRSGQNRILDMLECRGLSRHQLTNDRRHPGPLALRQAGLDPVLAQERSLGIIEDLVSFPVQEGNVAVGVQCHQDHPHDIQVLLGEIPRLARQQPGGRQVRVLFVHGRAGIAALHRMCSPANTSQWWFSCSLLAGRQKWG